jgi:subtilase family serine protease
MAGPALAVEPGAGVVPSRIVEPIDETRLVRLTGNTHPLAAPEFDLGLADAGLALERMQLVLKRGPEQEAALERLMTAQYDSASASFHHWLEPEEFGRLYGPSDADLAAVTNWLENHGFQIYRVSNGRVTIEFSGTAGQVREAFHTEIHQYRVKGVEHIANDRDPEIPEALAPVIAGVASLHNFFPRHQSHFGDYVRRDRKTGRVTGLDADESGATPLYTYGSNPAHEDISPYDFATIYNLLPLWNAGIDGTGETIAIAGLSDIVQADIDTWRSSFDLPAKTIQQLHNGADPGVLKTGGQGENTLDVEWSGAVAKNAAILLVVTATTATTYGGQLSASYIVDNKLLNGKVVPVMSASYGLCEVGLGTAGNAALNGIYQQGAAEGISIFVSSGDAGATFCDNPDTAGPNPAVYGLQVNGWASSPYVTAVGGTDFDWNKSTNQSTYWNATNDPTTGASAKGYIPELPWNSTCTSSWLLAQTTATSSEVVCNSEDKVSFLEPLVRVTGGSGGVSACTTSTGGVLASCGGGYAKPAWQTGTGVPADGKRDLPDVSLFASDGWPPLTGPVGSAYLFCVGSFVPDLSCDFSNSTYITYEETGGTSVSSPAMAGIMAMVLQKVGGAAQGLANPVLYELAAKDNRASCNTNTVAGGNICVFYDITTGTNAQVCKAGSLNCVANTSGDTLGVVSGYNSTTGFDLTTGLGSVNATNLVNAWSSEIVPVTATLTPANLTFASTKDGTSSAAQTVTLKNTSTVALDLVTGGITLSGTNASSFGETTTCGATVAAGASCTIQVTFKPTAIGTLTGTLSVASDATGSPQKVSLTGTGTASELITLTPATLAFQNMATGATSEAQAVTVANTGTGSVTISSIGIGGTNPGSFLQLNTCGSSLAAGASCTALVAFRPGTAATQTGTLSVASNATGSPQTVALRGTGTAVPTVKLSAASLSFASTVVGKTSEEQSVTISNTGSAAVEIIGIAVSGTNATSFTELNTCGTTLAAGGSCVAYVAFKPTATGALAGSLTITDTGGGSEQTVKLTGTGAS